MTRVLPSLALAGALCLTASGCSADTPAAASPVPASTELSVATEQAPEAGSVVQGIGPFDDRFSVTGLSLAGGAVSGALTVTSDVSELIVLEVHAAFYDEAGTSLGTEVMVHRDEHGDGELHTASEPVELAISAPEDYRAEVSSARVWVPVLVNE